MVLGFGPDDAATYGALNWKDAAGNLYAASSEQRDETPTGTLERPAWDNDNHVNMAGANRAQAALVFSPTPVAVRPDKLTACAGDDALAVLAEMGLTQVDVM